MKTVDRVEWLHLGEFNTRGGLLVQSRDWPHVLRVVSVTVRIQHRPKARQSLSITKERIVREQCEDAIREEWAPERLKG